MYALVKWTVGKWKGSFSIVDASWLLEIDLATFDNSEG